MSAAEYQPTVADMVRRGWVMRPAVTGTKHPGVKAHTAGISLDYAEKLGAGGQYNAIIGRSDLGFVSGIVDFETDSPEAEERLLEACGGSFAGPYFVNPSGSVHRIFAAPEIPAGYRLSLRREVLGAGVDAMWQNLFLDDDRRVWHSFKSELWLPPQALIDTIVVPERATAEPYTGPVADGWGGSVLTGEAEKLASLRGTAFGENRNDGAFEAGLKCGSAMAAGGLDEEQIVAVLLEAAEKNGSVAEERLPGDTERQIRNGIQCGAANPRGPKPAEVRTFDASPYQSDEETSTWAPVDVAAVLNGDALDPHPTMWSRADGLNLIYSGKVHAFNGESESGKSWAALAVCAEQLQTGGSAMYVDFEDSAASVIGRIKALGVPVDVIRARFAYLRPDEPLTATESARFLAHVETINPAVVVLDGVTEAMALHGWDPLSLKDVAAWLNLLAKPVVRRGPAVVLIDHVTKSRDNRGRFAIGSQHKMAGVDVAYMFDNVRPFGRGREGKTIVDISKDRPGWVRGGSVNPKKAGEFSMAERGGAVTTALRPIVDIERTADDKFRPTMLMEKASKILSGAANGLSQRDWLEAIGGKAEYARQAIDALVDEEYARRVGDGGRGKAYMYISLRPFTRTEWQDDEALLPPGLRDMV